MKREKKNRRQQKRIKSGSRKQKYRHRLCPGKESPSKGLQCWHYLSGARPRPWGEGTGRQDKTHMTLMAQLVGKLQPGHRPNLAHHLILCDPQTTNAFYSFQYLNKRRKAFQDTWKLRHSEFSIHSFIGTRPRSLLYVLSVAAFTCQRRGE